MSGAGSSTLTVGLGGGGGTFSGVIKNTSGTVSLIKTDNGTQTLSGNNTYTGGTTINGGVLQFNSDSAIAGSGANVLVNSGGTAAFGYAFTTTTLGRIATASSGVVALAAANSNNLSFSGMAGVSLGATGAFTYSGTLTPSGTTYMLGGGGGVLTVSSQLTGSNSLTVALNGTASSTVILLNATNAYSGGTTISSGTLQVGNGGSSGTLGTAAVTDNGDLVFDLSSNFTLANAVSGNGSLTQEGTGTLVLSGNNAYSGGTTVSAGTLMVGSATALGHTSGTVSVASGAVLDLNGQALGNYGNVTLSGTGTGNGALTNSSATAASLSGTINVLNPFSVGGTGNITLSGGLSDLTSSVMTKVGSNTLTLSGTGDNQGLSLAVSRRHGRPGENEHRRRPRGGRQPDDQRRHGAAGRNRR